MAEFDPIAEGGTLRTKSSDEFDPIAEGGVLRNNSPAGGVQNNSINGSPSFQEFFSHIASNANKYVGELNPDVSAAAYQGALEPAQSLKQIGLGLAEKFGKIPAGSADAYTQQVEKERQAYAQSPQAHDTSLNIFKSIVSGLPSAVALGPLGMEGPLLVKMAMSGLANAGIGALNFVPKGESRIENAKQGGEIGAALPVVGEALPLIANLGSNLVKNVKNAVPLGRFLQDMTPLEKNVFDATQELKNAQGNHDLIKQDIGQHLNENAAHDVDLAAQLKAAQSARQSSISQGYKDLENRFSEKNIQVNNIKDLQDKNDELLKLVQNNQTRTPEATKLIQDLQNLKENPSTNAKDYLHSLQSIKQYAREARSQAYTPGMNREERNEWMQQYKNLDDKVDEMGATLENSVGPEEMDNLSKLNTAWRTKVVPMYQNPIYQKLYKYGQMPDNIVKSLRGTNEGNVLLREMIKENPEMLKNAVGQRWAKGETGKNEVLNPNANMQEYLDKMPDLSQKIEHHENTRGLIDQAQNNIENAVDKFKRSESSQKYAGQRLSRLGMLLGGSFGGLKTLQYLFGKTPQNQVETASSGNE